VGKHKGLALYTIGQRKGIGIGGIGPFYVVRKDYKKNQLIVADPEHEKELYSKELICKNVNWVIGGPKLPLKCQARIRYQGELKNVEVLNLEGRKIGCSEYRNIGRSDVRNIGCSETRKCVVKFQKSIKAVAPGQSVVFYKNNKVLGGGIIS
jgi:tRNA-specific 2-thiouridylase